MCWPSNHLNLCLWVKWWIDIELEYAVFYHGSYLWTFGNSCSLWESLNDRCFQESIFWHIGWWVLSLFWLKNNFTDFFVYSIGKLIGAAWTFAFIKVIKKYLKVTMNCLWFSFSPSYGLKESSVFNDHESRHVWWSNWTIKLASLQIDTSTESFQSRNCVVK